MKIKNKILLTFLVTFSISISIVCSLMISNASRSLENQIEEHLNTAAQSRVDHINSYIDGNIKILKLITSRTKLRQDLKSYNQEPTQELKSSIISIIKDAAQSIEKIERVCVVDQEGIVIASTNSNFIDTDISQKEFFISGQKQEKAFFIEENGEIKIFITGPIFLDDQLLGIGIAVIKTDQLNTIVNEKTGLGQTGEIVIGIKGPDGQPLYLNKDQTEIFSVSESQPQDQRLIARALSGQQQFFEKANSYSGEKIIGVTKYIDDIGLGLVAQIDHQEALAPINQIYLRSAFLVIVSLFFFIVVSLWTARNISRPIEQLEKDTEEIKKGDFDHTSKINTKDEIGQLAKAFNQMVIAVKESRLEVDQKVAAQTEEIKKNAKRLEDQQKATLNVLEDIDEERKISLQRAQDLQKFQLAVENASDHIVITDPDGIILYANQAVTSITGFENKEVLGKKAGSKELWGGLMDKGFYKTFWKAIKVDKKDFAGEIKNKRKNGEEYIAEAKVSPILNDKKEVIFFIGIERDITKAKEVDRMKTEFISLASHQLRTPLSAMKWFLEMLLNGDLGELKKDQLEIIQNIDKSNERMIALVNGLLNISRIESGRIIIDPEPTDLKKLVDNVYKELSPNIKDKKIDFSITTHKDLPKIKIDPKLITEVYKNLLTNAIKYTPQKGDIEVAISKKDDQIISRISDSGMGIPKKEYTKVFQKFFRGENVVKQETDGTGLGLYLTKAIIDSSGGKIWFESEINKGTTFWFSLPVSGSTPKKGEVSISPSGVSSKKTPPPPPKPAKNTKKKK